MLKGQQFEQAILKALTARNKRALQNPEQWQTYQESVARGQAPVMMTIGCCDSRANPAIFLDAWLGEMFSATGLGAFVPNHEVPEAHALLGAVEYGVDCLNVPHLAIFGHTGCGAVQTLWKMAVEGLQPALPIARVLQGFVKDAEVVQKRYGKIRQQLGDDADIDPIDLLQKQTILRSYHNLMEYPSVKRAVAEKRLKVHALLFDLMDRSLSKFDSDHGGFHPVVSHAFNNGSHHEPHAPSGSHHLNAPLLAPPH
jgi:carbonic anhydrase